MTTRIELHIEELVLRGLAPDDRDGIGRAVQAELGRLFTIQDAGGRLTASARVVEIDAGAFTHASCPSAAAIGAEVAQAVFRGLHRAGGPADIASPVPLRSRGRLHDDENR